VVDFSTIKSDLKSLVDDRIAGFDHKLWLLNTSPCVVEYVGDKVGITSPYLSIEAPVDSIKVIDSLEYTLSTIAASIQRYLNMHLRDRGITVQCVNSTRPHLMMAESEYTTFRYCHGLRNSTSWACQNIAHGHLSYIQILNKNLNSNNETYEIRRRIASDLDNAIFIWSENVVSADREHVYLEYESRDRGRFTLSLNKDRQKIIILNKETTIEHIIEYVMTCYYKDLCNANVHRVAVSEGLTKGSLADVDDYH
jgi:hypothetical protein